MKLGVVLNGRRSASEIAALAKLAEEYGLAHFWLSGSLRTKDHFLRLGSAAQMTRRIQLGPVAISPFEMHPVRIGLSLLTLNEMSGGRASIVIGGGGDLAMTLGIPLRNRVQVVDETVDIIKGIAQGGEMNFRGRVFQTDGFFSPWKGVTVPPLYVGANRLRMLRMSARKADGIMVTDMPLSLVGHVVEQVHRMLPDTRRMSEIRLSNWFVWNLQETEEEALRLARRTLGFRLYYIQDIAKSIGLSPAEAMELKGRQPEMLRAIFENREPYMPSTRVAGLLIDNLTITGSRKNLDECIEKLRSFGGQGINEMALAVEGDPSSAIKLLGEKVVPSIRDGNLDPD